MRERQREMERSSESCPQNEVNINLIMIINIIILSTFLGARKSIIHYRCLMHARFPKTMPHEGEKFERPTLGLESMHGRRRTFHSDFLIFQ